VITLQKIDECPHFTQAGTVTALSAYMYGGKHTASGQSGNEAMVRPKMGTYSTCAICSLPPLPKTAVSPVNYHTHIHTLWPESAKYRSYHKYILH